MGHKPVSEGQGQAVRKIANDKKISSNVFQRAIIDGRFAKFLDTIAPVDLSTLHYPLPHRIHGVRVSLPNKLHWSQPQGEVELIFLHCDDRHEVVEKWGKENHCWMAETRVFEALKEQHSHKYLCEDLGVEYADLVGKVDYSPKAALVAYCDASKGYESPVLQLLSEVVGETVWYVLGRHPIKI